MENAQRPNAARFNNFGILRLVFASMVVLSHAPELVDGNRSREILTRIFHTLSFGEVGVDGFFLISGYLITRSFQTSSGLASFLTKRVARIYPAFLLATVVSIFFFAPLSGSPLSELSWKDWRHVIYYAATLQPPPVQAFQGTHYPALNGAMWTIAYEFRCYVLVACLGLLGILNRREFVLIGATIFILLIAAHPIIAADPSNVWVGNISQSIRMTGAFLAGANYFLYRDVIVYKTAYAAVASVVLAFCLLVPGLAESALCIFGGYLVFWLALKVPPSPVSSATTRHDISYGLYLYTWPIQSALVFFNKDIPPWAMFTWSLGLSAVCGYLSWSLLESKIQRIVHRRRIRESDVTSPGLPAKATHPFG